MTARAWRRVAMVLLAALVAGWFMALRPELAEREAARRDARLLASELAAHRAAAAELETWSSRVQTLRRRIDAHPMRLPAEPDLSGLLGRMTDIATASGIRLLGVTPKESTSTADYQRRSMTVRLTGRWQGLVEWLTRLGRETRSITMTRLIMTRRAPRAEGPPLRLTLALTGHWQRDAELAGPNKADANGWVAATPDISREAPAAFARNPFQSTTTNPAGSALDYLGRIRMGERVWALIRDADGRVHHHRPGATLPGGGQLEQVTATAITITRPGRDAEQDEAITRLRIGLDDSGG